MKTEQEHLRELVDALSAAKSSANKMIIMPTFEARRAFTAHMRRATVEAQSLNFYRNQQKWGTIAICLDQASKITIAHTHWPQVSQLLEALSAKVLTLANQRRN